MNAIELLTKQHEEVDALFEEIEDESNAEEKQGLFQEIADSLAAHATIEEKIFYPAAYVGDAKDILKEAVEEHLSVKRVIADLLTMSPDDEQFDAKIKVLKEQVQHHVQEEQDELFPEAKKNLNESKLEALGEQMEDMFDNEMASDPSAKVPAETQEAAPLPT